MSLLELPVSSEHDTLVDSLIQHPNTKILSFSSQWFVFFAFQQLLLEKITQEEFIAFGDSYGTLYDYQINPIFTKESLVYGLQQEPEHYMNTLIIVDKNNRSFIETMVPWLASLLKKIKSQIFYI